MDYILDLWFLVDACCRLAAPEVFGFDVDGSRRHAPSQAQWWLSVLATVPWDLAALPGALSSDQWKVDVWFALLHMIEPPVAAPVCGADG